MTVHARLDEPTVADLELWGALFDLAADLPTGWSVVGAQMVVVHAASHGILRPVRTADGDVLVDIRSLSPKRVARWLVDHGFELDHVDPFGTGHRFRRGPAVIDVLATDRSGSRADLSTIPSARTVEVPGGRRAAGRLVPATVSVGPRSGTVRLPDWTGALILKSRAAVAFKIDRDKHLMDLALLLGLPVDAAALARELADGERRDIGRGIELLSDEIVRSVAVSVDPRDVRAAARLVAW